MTAAEVVIVTGGSLVLMSLMTALTHRVNKGEQRTIERRHQEWVANGSIPEEKPNFYSGNACGGG
jgi:hypothetical protein